MFAWPSVVEQTVIELCIEYTTPFLHVKLTCFLGRLCYSKCMKIHIINYAQGRHVGYGEVKYHLTKTLQELNYLIVPYGEADVNLWFCWPRNNRPEDPGYHIAYLPWESTILQDGWVDKLNAMDEVWTPSPIIARWFEDLGVQPVRVFEHGVGPEWSRVYRENTGPLKFFHHGGDAYRKGGAQCVQAFNAAFPNDNDVQLVMKMYGHGWNIPEIGRMKIINNKYTLPDLIKLYHDQHIMVCNSYGEGFGLPALQGMATGMPLICTRDWAPYKRFIDLPVRASLIDSPWPEPHPGKVWEPNFDELVDRMRYAKDNFDVLAHNAYDKALDVHAEYDWKNVTLRIFEELEQRVINSKKLLAR